MNKSLRIFPLLVVVLFLPFSTAAQTEDEFYSHSDQVSYSFADRLEFQFFLEEDSSISEVDIILQTPRTPSFIGIMTPLAGGEWFFSYDLDSRPLPAFSPVSYAFRIIRDTGEEYTTEKKSFTYFDNRYNWQQLQEEPFDIYWYEGDLTFAQQVLDAAQKGKEQMLDLLQQPEDNQPINIFIYSSEDQLQQTLQSTNQSWVGGHAAPELSAVVVSLPPGVEQSLEIQQKIPHEISHILLYRFMGTEYQYLPVWLSEGIASQMEFFPRPDYSIILEKAAMEQRLIPIAQLCQVFPSDPELVLLAYAEAASILRYIQEEYGTTGIQALIAAYDQGVSCDRGVEIALGRSLARLEREWKQANLFRSRNLIIIAGLTLLLLILLLAISRIIFRKLRNTSDQPGDSNDD